MIYRGVVQRGTRYGTKIGFPTANIEFDGPESGIFAAHATLGDKRYAAVAYADQQRKILEAHMADYCCGDLYGEIIEIEVLQKIREDRRFDDEEKLKTQIKKDFDAAIEILKTV